MNLSDVVANVLREYSTESYDNQGLHSWRCEYYEDIDGPCECFSGLVASVTAAVIIWIAENP